MHKRDMAARALLPGDPRSSCWRWTRSARQEGACRGSWRGTYCRYVCASCSVWTGHAALAKKELHGEAYDTCTYVHVCTYVHICTDVVYIHAYIQIHTNILYMCINAWMYTCTNVCTCASISRSTCSQAPSSQSQPQRGLCRCPQRWPVPEIQTYISRHRHVFYHTHVDINITHHCKRAQKLRISSKPTARPVRKDFCNVTDLLLNEARARHNHCVHASSHLLALGDLQTSRTMWSNR